MYNKHLYIPRACTISAIREETPDIKTFKLSFREKWEMEGVDLVEESDFRPGQFVQVSVLGLGEAPISISSSPKDRGYIEISVKASGSVTEGIHGLKEGGEVGLRGPYGNAFPIDDCKGKDFIFIGGGVGLAPLRSLIRYVMSEREAYGDITILYGARSSKDIIFREELDGWNAVKDTKAYYTIDRPEPGWSGNVGVVTTLLKDIGDIKGAKVFVCGPPIMISFALKGILSFGARDEDIYLSLERYMKCGVGKCGHCYIGGKYACMDGAVFSYAQLKDMEVEEAAGV
ncbi:MAG: hydrogenase [Candidatus Omnitrophica bacterium CG1_02_49_10]|nr:MAG: hydrogenase [Candidatus Omnitrophica bacterium CG1_02_49_10]